MKKRILTGIQSSGRQHLGNILGAIKPSIELSAKPEYEGLLFIADLHSLITIKDAEIRKNNIQASASAWLAMGLDSDKNIFYKQSDIPEVCELAWYLNCFAPFPMLANAHSFKDKSEKLAEVNAGLFTYPVLMAADILLYNADWVPVGKDQKQHLEITRDLAKSFNNMYGDTFVLPEARINERLMTIPGTDGQKMSKSYNNYIDIFLPEKQLKKQINSIVTDSLELEDPKDPNNCIVYDLFSLVATESQAEEMASKLRAGNYGYGHAKKELLEIILEEFKEPRRIFESLENDKTLVENELKKGAEKARKIALVTLSDVKNKLGY